MTDKKVSRAFISMVIMFCLFLAGIYYCIGKRIEILENKIESYTQTCNELSDMIAGIQETDRRILEQNMMLITEINIDRDQ